MELVFRNGTLSDLAVMQKLFVESVKTVCVEDYNALEIEEWVAAANNQKRWIDLINEQWVLLVENEGLLVGFGSVTAMHYLDFLYVHHLYQRKGVAKQLCDAIELKVLEHGGSMISTDASITALPFFIHRGYELVKENHHERNGQLLINFHLQKSLF